MGLSANDLLLIPAILVVPGYAMLSRSAVRRRCDLPSLTLVTLFTAALDAFLSLLIRAAPAHRMPPMPAPVIYTSLIGGASNAVSMIAYYAAIAAGPVGLVSTISAMSPIIPVSASILFLGERPTTAQMFGGVFLLAGLVLINLRGARKRQHRDLSWTTLAVLAMVTFGLYQFSMKVIHVASPGTSDVLFTTLVYAAGSSVLAAFFLARRIPFDARALPSGVLLGCLSSIQTYCMVAALKTVPTAVVFLSVLGGGPVLVIIFSTLCLRERYTGRIWLGVATGLCGICLMAQR